jgi:hypothetical protein
MRWVRCAVLLAAAALIAGCTENDAGTTDTNAADADAEARSTWDPVWHDTTPKQWPTIGPAGQPDCGVGCRMLLNGPVPDPVSYFSFSYDAKRVVSEGYRIGTMMETLDSTQTTVLEQPPYEWAVPYVAGRRIIFLGNLGPGDGEVEVMDLITGETKTVYSYTPADAGVNNVTRTALNTHYAFWTMDGKGLMSRDLQTGEVKLRMPGSFVCHDICATEHEVICADADSDAIYDYDLDTGKAAYLDYGGALQLEGFCSPDRTQFVWIDYRDPPGRNSDYDFQRSGGEVYLRDLVAKKTRRITYDSPNSPHGKNWPAVDGNFVYWNQTPDGANQNPNQAQNLYALSTTLVRFDLTTGQKCELANTLMSYKAVYGPQLVHLWIDKTKGQTRLVVTNLDDPGLQWQCQTVPIPP